MAKLRIGTRGSRLALVQTEMLCKRLKEAVPDCEYEVIICKTLGDRRPDINLMLNENRGVFCGELEERLLNQEIDLAVHSVKDLPGELLPGLALAGFLEREDPREVLVGRDGMNLIDLPRGARIGTSSVRRLLQLRDIRSDLEFQPIRGNVETRIQKVQRGEYDATILALAGIRRLGMEEVISEVFSIDTVLPAPCQGCIGAEIRQDDTELFELLHEVSHLPTMMEVRAERAFLKRMGGYCQAAVGANAVYQRDCLPLKGMYSGSEDKILRETLSGASDQPERLGKDLAEKLLELSVDHDA
jgi:hydroxymethylbilane synthase